MLLALAAGLAIAVLSLTFLLRPKDIPAPAGVTPWNHLEGRKASIYENLRDLQFEYRVGKLSDADYQRTKTELQSELAAVLTEIDQLKAAALLDAEPPVARKREKARSIGYTCPHCKAQFDKALKFCGECGKSMKAPA